MVLQEWEDPHSSLLPVRKYREMWQQEHKSNAATAGREPGGKLVSCCNCYALMYSPIPTQSALPTAISTAILGCKLFIADALVWAPYGRLQHSSYNMFHQHSKFSACFSMWIPIQRTQQHQIRCLPDPARHTPHTQGSHLASHIWQSHSFLAPGTISRLDPSDKWCFSSLLVSGIHFLGMRFACTEINTVWYNYGRLLLGCFSAVFALRKRQ